MIKKLDFELKHSQDAIWIDGKCIIRGNDKARWFANKLKEVCRALDELREVK